MAASGESIEVHPDPRGPRKSSTRPSPAYVHLTTNNTIYGTQWRTEPPVPAGVPLVADTSSDMFSRPIDVTKYGLIYAGAQKNLGPSGIVLVIMRDGPGRGAAAATLPTMLQYRTYAKEKLALQHAADLRDLHGGPGAQVDPGDRWPGQPWRNGTPQRPSCCTISWTRATSSAAPVHPDSRSLMNVCFRAPTDELETVLRRGGRSGDWPGSRGIGRPAGCGPASTTPAPAPASMALVKFMKEFERANPSSSRD